MLLVHSTQLYTIMTNSYHVLYSFAAIPCHYLGHMVVLKHPHYFLLVLICNNGINFLDNAHFFNSTAFEPRETQSHSLLIIQCDSGHLNGDLIACARYRVSDIRGKQTDCRTHVLFIVQLPRKVPSSSFVGFQGNPWICAHVDNLCIDSDSLSVSAALLQAPISELFYSLEFVSDSSDSSSEITTSELQYPPQCQRLNGCIHAAASRLYDAEKDQQRITERVERLKELIPEEFSFPLGKRWLPTSICPTMM